MQVPYGAVYFRKSNPPQNDWERDYQTAAQDGLNVFRHWFMWGSIETSPGNFDWKDYDQQLDLAEKYGIKTIIAEMLTIPEWLYSQYPEMLYVKNDGSRCSSKMGGSSSSGGWNAGPCLDNPQGREMAANFLQQLAERYKDHPAMLGYDIWNECNYNEDICYCDYTVGAFQKWLENKYGDISAINLAWHRYSYTQWNQIQPPPELSLYPECIDWIEFRKENFYNQMQWRVDTIRNIDAKNIITAHGTADSINPSAAMRGSDDWTAASKVQIYGFTWVASRRGNEPWKQFHAVDIVRAGSRGKQFWHAETQGGPLWLQPQVIGRPREDGRVTTPGDIQLWNLVSLAGGARGFLNPRMRPLLDGPLFGAFGAYGMDGTRTACSDMAGAMARWLNDPAQAELLKACPVKGDIGVLFIPESQIFSRLIATQGKWNFYSDMMWGAYKGFFDNNIQADWVHVDDIDQYDTIYMPYPIMFKSHTADKLKKWIENGGILISEGCPGYFGDGGTVGTTQPNLGLSEVFGVKQNNVEFVPDLLNDLRISYMDQEIYGGTYIQTFQCSTAQPCGFLDDGSVIAARNSYGKGHTILIGTCPSETYLRKGCVENKSFFANILKTIGKSQNVASSNDNVKVRLQESSDKKYLWALNMSKQVQDVVVTLSDKFGNYRPGMNYRAGNITQLTNFMYKINVPSQDAVIFSMIQS